MTKLKGFSFIVILIISRGFQLSLRLRKNRDIDVRHRYLIRNYVVRLQYVDTIDCNK